MGDEELSPSIHRHTSMVRWFLAMKKFAWMWVALMFLILTGCRPNAGDPKEANGDLVGSLAQQTSVAKQTEVAFQTFVAQLSEVPPTLTPNPKAPYPTATFEPIVIDATVQPETFPAAPTGTQVPCDWAKFISDVSVEDNTKLSSGEAFTKTWRVQNIGTCTWTEGYTLFFSSGDEMGGMTSVNLEKKVRPGDNIDISIPLIAPAETGKFTSNWKLRNEQGVVFGIGENATAPLGINIEVTSTQPTDPNKPVDFTAIYCTAEWYSLVGQLPCPSLALSGGAGAVVRSEKPVLEGGYVDNEPALITVPSSGSSGYIQGKYPPFMVQEGDRFQVVIGCLEGYPDCNVTFLLNYTVDNGPLQNLGSWGQTNDGRYERVTVDLSALAGKSVQFILAVDSNGDAKDDRAFWLLPIIRR